MVGFIDELYYGNINPNEKRYNFSTEYAKAVRMFCENEEKLANLLSGDKLKLFNNLVDLSDEISAVTGVENFKLGFRLGVQMICDSLIVEDNKIFRDITF